MLLPILTAAALTVTALAAQFACDIRRARPNAQLAHEVHTW